MTTQTRTQLTFFDKPICYSYHQGEAKFCVTTNAVATTVGTNLAHFQRAADWIFVMYSRPARNQCFPAVSQIV